MMKFFPPLFLVIAISFASHCWSANDKTDDYVISAGPHARSCGVSGYHVFPAGNELTNPLSTVVELLNDDRDTEDPRLGVVLEHHRRPFTDDFYLALEGESEDKGNAASISIVHDRVGARSYATVPSGGGYIYSSETLTFNLSTVDALGSALVLAFATIYEDPVLSGLWGETDNRHRALEISGCSWVCTKASACLAAGALPLAGPKKVVNWINSALSLINTDFCSDWIAECYKCFDKDPLNSPHEIEANKECMKKAMAAYEKCNSEENRKRCRDKYPFDAGGAGMVGMGFPLVCHHPVDGDRNLGEPAWERKMESGVGPPQEGFHCPSGNPPYTCNLRCFDTRPESPTRVPTEKMNCGG